MTAERWRRVGELFHEAIDISSEDRPEWIDRACGDDQELRREVLSLLESATAEFGALARKYPLDGEVSRTREGKTLASQAEAGTSNADSWRITSSTPRGPSSWRSGSRCCQEARKRRPS